MTKNTNKTTTYSITAFGLYLCWTILILATIYFLYLANNTNSPKFNKSLSEKYTIENPYISEESTEPLNILDFKEDFFEEICHDHRIYLYHKESNQIIQKANNYKC